MKKNSNVFLNVGDRYLFMDLILVEYHYPILFTCIDNKGIMYISTCFHADAQEKEWLIARTNPASVLDLLCNRISIRDIFPKGDEPVYVAAKSKEVHEPVITTHKADDVPEEIFPTPEMFMDADEDEFLEELEILRRRCLLSQKKNDFCEIARWQAGQFSWRICIVTHSPRVVRFKDEAFETTVCGGWERSGVIYEPV